MRRPIPVAKALDDALLAYEMNGEPLPPDHGFPLRLVVPGWIGVANIKWVGQIEVSATPLFSLWNTTQYVMTGPTYPGLAAADDAGRQERVRAAGFGATFPAGGRSELTGPLVVAATAPIRRVDVSDRRRRRPGAGGAARRERPEGVGALALRLDAGARRAATRCRRARPTRPAPTQPATVPFNDGGYLFAAVVKHPAVVA